MALCVAHSLNLFLLHDMYHRICEPLLYSIAAGAGVLMHFMLITLTYLLGVWIEWVVFLEVFSISHSFIQFFLVRTCLMCSLLWSVMYPVAQNLFFYLFVDLFQTVASGNFFWIYMTLSVGIVLSACIIEIHVLLWWNPWYDCRWLHWKPTNYAISSVGASQLVGLTWYISDPAGNDLTTIVYA